MAAVLVRFWWLWWVILVLLCVGCSVLPRETAANQDGRGNTQTQIDALAASLDQITATQTGTGNVQNDTGLLKNPVWMMGGLGLAMVALIAVLAVYMIKRHKHAVKCGNGA